MVRTVLTCLCLVALVVAVSAPVAAAAPSKLGRQQAAKLFDEMLSVAQEAAADGLTKREVRKFTAQQVRIINRYKHKVRAGACKSSLTRLARAVKHNAKAYDGEVKAAARAAEAAMAAMQRMATSCA